MKIITINLPEKYLSAIQILTDLKIYPSRSESIRKALHEFLLKDLVFNSKLEKESLEILIRSRGDRN